MLNVAHIIGDLDQRWTVPGNRKSNTSRIEAGGERDALLHLPSLYGGWLIGCLRGLRSNLVRADEPQCSRLGDGLCSAVDAQLAVNLVMLGINEMCASKVILF